MEQKRVLDIYTSAKVGTDQFLEYCVQVRQSILEGQREFGISERRINQIVDYCRDLFLALIDEDCRELAWFHADRTGFQKARGVHHEIEPIARAELTLRQIAIHSLDCAHQKFRKSVRLSEWDNQIHEAVNEFKTAVNAWIEVKQSWPGIGPSW
jgi:hypothetical protein